MSWKWYWSRTSPLILIKPFNHSADPFRTSRSRPRVARLKKKKKKYGLVLKGRVVLSQVIKILILDCSLLLLKTIWLIMQPLFRTLSRIDYLGSWIADVHRDLWQNEEAVRKRCVWNLFVLKTPKCLRQPWCLCRIFF